MHEYDFNPEFAYMSLCCHHLLYGKLLGLSQIRQAQRVTLAKQQLMTEFHDAYTYHVCM